MPRFALLCSLGLVLCSGCASSKWTASRSDASALAEATRVLANRPVVVELANGSEEGRLVDIRQDSTRWVSDADALRAVPTSSVLSIALAPSDRMAKRRRWTGEGLGLAAGIAGVFALDAVAPKTDGLGPNAYLLIGGWPVLAAARWMGLRATAPRALHFVP